METRTDHYRDIFLDHLRVERGLAANTVEAYGRDVRRYLEFLSDRGLSGPETAGRSTVMAWLLDLDKAGIGSRSRARFLAGMALIIAALCSTRRPCVVQNAEVIDRGYEQLEDKLRALGADIVREASRP